ATTTSEELSLDTPTATLPGTLLVPLQQAEGAPVVLLIAGSGPTDRNGNSPVGVSANTLSLVAQALADAGIASLRYDKIGSGASRPKITKEEELAFETYGSHAAGWLEMLKGDARFKTFFVVGHSEGSLVGMLAAQAQPVDGFVSVACAGRNIADVLIEQIRAQLPAGQAEEAERVVNELRAGRTVAASTIQLPPETRDGLFRDSLQPFLISWMKLDPAVEVAKLTARVAVVQGSTDLQTSLADAERLAAAARVEPVILEGVNHVLKQAPAERNANLATYRNPDLPLGPGVRDALVGFVLGK
ncbi:MAG: alpha/beta hydrolase, partial [Myxococcales bacterium]